MTFFHVHYQLPPGDGAQYDVSLDFCLFVNALDLMFEPRSLYDFQ